MGSTFVTIKTRTRANNSLHTSRCRAKQTFGLPLQAQDLVDPSRNLVESYAVFFSRLTSECSFPMSIIRGVIRGFRIARQFSKFSGTKSGSRRRFRNHMRDMREVSTSVHVCTHAGERKAESANVPPHIVAVDFIFRARSSSNESAHVIQ